jgi:hypothetical protein
VDFGSPSVRDFCGEVELSVLFLSRQIKGSSFSNFLPCFHGAFLVSHTRCSVKYV